ncbi:flagellar basal body P-ring formation chaperone FlgA [Actibacterium sp. MT2.3-13A]|uniref:flagellar basal body P-ring formation chaperone FlgA n=1 Tax=Actibacterium sp. MT2.3-13A TaxID=2828332 RepID=UPI001BAA290E|nr:flagellar basal body P-ring formation chaperone FlgA [Actibacterium sp. MT2.3-13A]
MKRLVFFLVLALLPGLAGAEALDVLIEEKARAEFGATLPDTGEFEITLKAGGLEEAVMLSAFWMDRATGQFVANAVTGEGELRRVTGLALLTVPVPVPVRRLMPEEIIAEADLRVLRLPHGRVGSFAVTRVEDLVGMQVRSLLAQGRPVMAQSVQAPRIIDRGDKVAIRYTDGLLELTAPGRALADAHRGQEVKIVNLVSNASVVGIATAEGVVEVTR